MRVRGPESDSDSVLVPVPGGDEVNTGCWGSVASVAAWLKQHGLDGNGGYEYFVKRGERLCLPALERHTHAPPLSRPPLRPPLPPGGPEE